MPGIEKEMIGLLFHGASNAMDNIRIAFFLMMWSAMILMILWMMGIQRFLDKKEEEILHAVSDKTKSKTV